MQKINTSDARWGQYIPFLFRSTDFSIQYESAVNFLSLISSALYRHFKYNEPKIANIEHFEELLISDTFNRYKIDIKKSNYQPCYRISKYFSPEEIKQLVYNDFADLRAEYLLGKIDISKIDITESDDAVKRFFEYFRERIHTLEVLLHNLPSDNQWVIKLKNDINRFFVASGISLMYDLKLNLIRPIEEPLLQNIIDTNLLPRISAISEERANEFINAYHSMLNGEPADEIFINAFKTLEEFARMLIDDNKFEFKKDNIVRHFPNLHPTIITSIEKLKAHRGDEAGHGKNAPEEIRYLLFTIINVALLLIDYKEMK